MSDESAPPDPPASQSKARQQTPSWVLRVPGIRKRLGLGDAVAAVAKPLARAVQKLSPAAAAALGIDPDCEPCAERQKLLNAYAALEPRDEKE